jgi:hypothetical protein
MTTQDPGRPRNTHGGRRPGAGAPRGNFNALRVGNHSPRHKDATSFIALIPELRQRWLDLRWTADSQGTSRQSRERQRRARYLMQVMLDAAAAVISPRNYILGYIAEVARERLEPPTPWRVRKYALMALKIRAAPDERAYFILMPLVMIREDAPDLAQLLFQPLIEDFEAREAALLRQRRLSVAAECYPAGRKQNAVNKTQDNQTGLNPDSTAKKQPK